MLAFSVVWLALILTLMSGAGLLDQDAASCTLRTRIAGQPHEPELLGNEAKTFCVLPRGDGVQRRRKVNP